MSSITIRVGN